MQDIWKRIEAWLAVHASELLDTLKPGATEVEIQDTENYLGVSLPQDIKAFYQIHDGQWSWEEKQLQPKDYSLYDMHQFLPLARLREEWQIWVDVHENTPLEEKWVTLESGETVPAWSKQWIPLTADGCGSAYFLDLSAVLMGGNVGQILEYRNCDGFYLTSPSFRAWVETFVADLEAGFYWYDSEMARLLDERIFSRDN